MMVLVLVLILVLVVVPVRVLVVGPVRSVVVAVVTGAFGGTAHLGNRFKLSNLIFHPAIRISDNFHIHCRLAVAVRLHWEPWLGTDHMGPVRQGNICSGGALAGHRETSHRHRFTRSPHIRITKSACR